jgi:S-adenosylmethionine decarboxylase proenzyme
MIVGTEWLIEAAGCNADNLRNESVLRLLFERLISDLGLKSVGAIWHKFEGEGGVTGLIALTESHLACHTYPEHGIATFNLYCCRTRPEWDWETNLREVLDARAVTVHRIERGVANFDRKIIKFGEVTIRDRGRLPHWEKEEGIYFVTFRLADSLPQHVLAQLEHERYQAEQILAGLDRESSASEKQKLDWLFSEKVNEYLDKNFGACLLRKPEAAQIVADSIRHFDGQRYHLYAWCVMPNHVHVVFKALNRNKLDEILHSWKSFTSNEVNKAIGRNGELWQREYFDHLIRSEAELRRVVNYVEANPVKARLGKWRWVENLLASRIAQAR